MSGFSQEFVWDIIDILRDNVFLHGEALGWIVRTNAITPANSSLLKELEDRKFPVTGKLSKPVVRFDYIVIDYSNLNLQSILKAFSLLSNQGLLIMEVTDYPYELEKKYPMFGAVTGTMVKYGDRRYLVIHSGADYGN